MSMSQSLSTLVKGALCAIAITLCFATTPARAQVQIDLGPTDAYIATTSPVYYGGRASYWYGNRWYYRDGGAWRYYHHEPAYFRNYRGGYRGGYAPSRQLYGRGRGWGGGRRR
jgi:hypothetical protein